MTTRTGPTLACSRSPIRREDYARSRLRRAATLGGFLLIALPSAGRGQQDDPTASGRGTASVPGPTAPAGAPPRLTSGQVVLDGRPVESVWGQAWVVPEWYQLTPNEGEPPSETTEVRIYYDDQAVYVAAWLHGRDPSAIVDRYSERDAYHRSDQDGIGIVLDGDRDPRTGYGFIVTPSGGRTDVAVVDERSVSWNIDWNAFWDAESVLGQDGWTAEMRIPFSSLRFEPDENGAVRLGIIVWRYLARNDEFSVFPSIPNNWQNSAYKARNTLNKSVPGTLDLRGGSSRAERNDRGGGRWSR